MFFFFKQKTAYEIYQCDWSSDVCSSDLYNHSSINSNENNYPLIKPESIDNYILYTESGLFVDVDFENQSVFKTKELFKNTPKLLTKFVSNNIVFAIDRVGFVNTNVVYNCHIKTNKDGLNYYKLLGWLNSKLVSFWFKTTFLNLDTLFPHIQKNQLTSIILPANNFNWGLVEKLVDIILSKKEQQKDTSFEERQIDLHIYKFYNLTYDEVKIIEPGFEMSKVEYEKI